ncbi:MAG: hypothetical protein AAFO91_00555 [Bacteroidota bacterium]
MNRKTTAQACLVASLLVLIGTAGVWLWPFIGTTRFWLGAGMVVGIVGTFLSSIALNHFNNE